MPKPRTTFFLALLLSFLMVSQTSWLVLAKEQTTTHSIYLPVINSGAKLPPTEPAPVISNFQANPAIIGAGESTTLTWSVRDATRISISGIGDVNGTTIQVQPTITTEYTITAFNSVTFVVAKVTVFVNPNSSNDSTGSIWLPYDTEDHSVVNVVGTSMAVDPLGGIHGTYVIPFGGDAGHFPVYYVYCPSNCGNPAQWIQTRLSDNVQYARLQLTRDGRPRIMLYTYAADHISEVSPHDYLYATCDFACTDPNQWTIVTLLTVQDGFDYSPYNLRWFALDAEDRPAFVYVDLEDEHNGAFYHVCQGDCSDPSQWHDQFLNRQVIYFELAFTPAGEPRILWMDVSDVDHSVKIAYIECNIDCSQLLGGAWIGECGPFCSYTMALDSQGHPRIVFYTGDLSTLQTLQAQRMYYFWCNINCGTGDDSAWLYSQLPTSQFNGMTQQLVLDQNDHPHLAYQMADEGLGYLSCTAKCIEAVPIWQYKQLVDNSQLDAEFPNNLNLRCSFQKWASGHRSSLALAPGGNLVVGFDVSHSYYGNDIDHPGQPCNPSSGNLLSTDIQLSRVAIFAQS